MLRCMLNSDVLYIILRCLGNGVLQMTPIRRVTTKAKLKAKSILHKKKIRKNLEVHELDSNIIYDL